MQQIYKLHQKMKHIINFTMLMLAYLAAYSQNPKYTASMERYIKVMNEANSATTYENALAGFDRIARNEAGEWLPNYYKAYVFSRMAILESDNKKKDELLDKGIDCIIAAGKIAAGNAEVNVVHAMLLGLKISVEPLRGQALGMQSNALIQEAKIADPQNPRVYLMLGLNALYTPEAYGGGKEKAENLIEKSIEYFKTYKPANSIMPAWGLQRAQQVLEECKN